MNSNKDQFRATYHTIKSLCEGLEGECDKIFMDRYYIGVQTVLNLKDLKTGICGTIKMYRLHIDKENKEIIEKIGDRCSLFSRPSTLLLKC